MLILASSYLCRDPTKLSDFCFIGIDLKKASKAFAQRFSCGSSVTGDDEIVIQGDVSGDVIDFIQNKWSEVRLEE